MTARVGIYGELGMGNIGNDASLEAMLAYLEREHPDVAVDAMCFNARTVTKRFGLPAVAMSWYQDHAPGSTAVLLKVLGKLVDPFRVAAWVRRHDAVIIPGMGIFDATLPVRAWSLPLGLFLVSLSGRLFGTKVGYVSVGADMVSKRPTRWLFANAARLATYRSGRDESSAAVLRQWAPRGTIVPVYPDLAFALEAPEPSPGDPKLVCVGVMDYRGSNDDRGRAAEISRSYIAEMTRFIRWLLAEGYRVRMIIGDTNGSDESVLAEIVARLRNAVPGLDDACLVTQTVDSLSDILAAMAPAGTVVAIRFHNVVAALMLGKPTIAISYGAKHVSLMTEAGVAEYCHPVQTLRADDLASQFIDLTQRALPVARQLSDRKAVNERLLSEQFAMVSNTLIPR